MKTITVNSKTAFTRKLNKVRNTQLVRTFVDEKNGLHFEYYDENEESVMVKMN